MPREREAGRIDFVLSCRRCATLMGGDSRRGKKLRFETRINAAIQGLCTKNTTSIRHPTEPTTTRIANGRYGGQPRHPDRSRRRTAVHPTRPIPGPFVRVGFGARACEKVIATNEQAILCHWMVLRQYKEFGRAALSAIELLVLVRVRSSHTTSPHCRH